MLYVIAKSVSKKDKVEETKEAMLALIEPTRIEKGCVQYDLHQDQEHPENFFFIEQWDTKEDLDNHLKNKHLVKWSKQQKELLASPMEVFMMDRLA